MIGLNLADQTAYFLWSLALGLALGAVYDLVRAARLLLKARGAHIIISDIVFFVLCGIATSLFALPFNKGDVRAFIIFGEAVGFLAYRLTLGSVMGKLYSHAAVFLRKIIQKVHKYLEVFFNLLLKMTSRLVYNIGVLIDKSLKRAIELNKLRTASKADSRLKDGENKGRSNEQKIRKKRKARVKRKDRAQREGSKRR